MNAISWICEPLLSIHSFLEVAETYEEISPHHFPHPKLVAGETPSENYDQLVRDLDLDPEDFKFVRMESEHRSTGCLEEGCYGVVLLSPSMTPWDVAQEIVRLYLQQDGHFKELSKAYYSLLAGLGSYAVTFAAVRLLTRKDDPIFAHFAAAAAARISGFLGRIATPHLIQRNINLYLQQKGIQPHVFSPSTH